MCGIIAYSGKRPIKEVILTGLKQLSYRGYDSAGIGIISSNKNIVVYKQKGKVENLINYISPLTLNSHVGIGHTRWATHGVANNANAHPHLSLFRNLGLVHNGIIENYNVLKKELLGNGYTFQSDTDTEVLVNFIDYIQKIHQCTILQALHLALKSVVGAYAIVMLDSHNPYQLIAAKKGSPMVIGIKKEEYFIASDITPIVAHTQDVIFLQDDEIALINHNKLTITNAKAVKMTPLIEKLDIHLESIEKGNFAHFMLKEIFEQPQSLKQCMLGRLQIENQQLILGGIRDYISHLTQAKRIIIIACGTSYYAGLVGAYVLEDMCRIPVIVEYASEFRYKNPIIYSSDIILAISQSGETADTLAAVQLAKQLGATILGICNVVGSALSRITQTGIYTHAGPEIGVASTKAFTAQLMSLTMLALKIAQEKGCVSTKKFKQFLYEIYYIPSKIELLLKKISPLIKKIAKIFKHKKNFIYLGRGYNYPVAMEGALKLKEISYIHAEGYPAAEMKHGPIALIDEDMPVVCIATKDHCYEKIISNIQEIKARHGKVIAVVTEKDQYIQTLTDHVIEVPDTPAALMPMVVMVPLQLLAYYIAIERGCNVDMPRNLAKSVTVE